MKRLILVLVVIVGLVLTVRMGQPPQQELLEDQSRDSNRIRIGVVTPSENRHPEYNFLTRLAENEINEYCDEHGISKEFEFVITCAESDSMKALEQVQGFYADDIRIVLGLSWTTHLCTSRGFSESRDMILMSTGSSGSHLRFEDYCFRLYPYDGYQAKPIFSALKENGIENLLVIKSTHAEYNQDIMDELMPMLENSGIEVLIFEVDHMDNEETVKYFTGLASTKLDELLVNRSVENTGVLMISFEMANFMKVNENSSLLKVKWFGSDMSVNDSYILREAPEVAALVSLVSPKPMLTKTSEYERVNELYRAELNSDLNYMSANMYDSCWIIGKTIIETNSTDYDTLLEHLPIVAETYEGASGLCELDEYGDRLHSQYDIYEYRMVDGKVNSVKTGVYEWSEEVIDWID